MHELEVLFCFQFLLDSKISKVQNNLVSKPCPDGGLNMLAIATFLFSMKIIWLQRIAGIAGESSYSKTGN